MPITIHDLKFTLSGGAANENPFLCFGGEISTAANNLMISQISTPPVTITGVTIVSAFGNPEGTGILLWDNATNFLSWKPYGQSVYYGDTITGDGQYLLGSEAGYLVVDIVFASLPGSNKTDTLTVANNPQNLYDVVPSAEALLGSIKYRGLYIKNTNATVTATGVRVWIDEQTPAGDHFEIGLDPAGIGNGITTGIMTIIASETDVPAGVVFSATPISYATGLVIGDLLPDETIGVWLKRIVPVETRGTVIGNSAAIAFATSL